MAEIKLSSPGKLWKQWLASYNVSSVVLCVQYAKHLDHILISNFVVANLFMHSLSGMILLYLAAPFLH